jgi:hypothetical protein
MVKTPMMFTTMTARRMPEHTVEEDNGANIDPMLGDSDEGEEDE